MFPPLRAAWPLDGEQAAVRISGRNAKRVLFGAINPRTGHRVVQVRRQLWQQDFQAFLRELRRRYPRRPLWLLLDRAPCHTALRSQALAVRLGLELLWLPKQCSDLNAMDQLWRELKLHVSANRQYATVDEHSAAAEAWVLGLTLRKPCERRGPIT